MDGSFEVDDIFTEFLLMKERRGEMGKNGGFREGLEEENLL